MCVRSLAPGILMPRDLSGSCDRAEMWSQACACCRMLDASSGAWNGGNQRQGCVSYRKVRKQK